MEFTLQTADVVSDATNCFYPNRVTVGSARELREAVKSDHVCAVYRKNYRSAANFMKSDVLVMDCDNDHSEDPKDWITAEKLERMLGDVSFALVPSRSHLLPKGGKAPRPKYHVYFAIHETTDAERYAALKRAVQRKYPFFDGNALDAARFLFGSDSGDVLWHEGWTLIDEEVTAGGQEEDEGGGEEWEASGTISLGSRNRTLSHFAGRVLKRFGETERAEKIFLNRAEKCDPPLEKEELAQIWRSARKFFRETVRAQEGYVDPEKYEEDFRNASLMPEDFSDIGQAKVFAREYMDELRYSDATDFLRYDGKAWIEDRQLAAGAMVEFLDLQLADAQETMFDAHQGLMSAGVTAEQVRAGGKGLEKLAAGAGLQEELNAYLAAKKYLGFVMKHRDWKYVAAVMNAAKPMLPVRAEELDRDCFLLNTPLETFDLRKGMAGGHAHTPGDLSTKITAYAPGDDGKKLWEDSLNLFFKGDRELIGYVQLVVGMAAVGRVYQEHLIIAYGDGANGKSTFWNTVSRVMGTYSGKLSADALTMACRRNIKPEMAELKGKRLVIASEMEEGMRLNTSMVKQLCSTDEIFAEKKYKAPFSFVPSHTLVLYTNHLPRVGAYDDGIWRRLVVIPFTAKIRGDGDIQNYADFLYENAGPYVMKWIIEGAEKAISMKFRIPLPKRVREAVDAYREDNDWMGHFLEECCEMEKSYMERSGDLYQRYREHAAKNGEFIRSQSDFYSALENAGFWKCRLKSGVKVYGLRLKTETDFL